VARLQDFSGRKKVTLIHHDPIHPLDIGRRVRHNTKLIFRRGELIE